MELYDSLQKFVVSSDNFETLKSRVEPVEIKTLVKRKVGDAVTVLTKTEEPQNKKEKRDDEEKKEIKREDKRREPKAKIDYEYQVPPDNDTLFWCFYYMSRKEDADFFENHNIVQEKQLKIHWVEEVRKNKGLLKLDYKFASLAHIENQLANETRIDLPTFLSLCAIEQMDVCVLRKKTHFPLICSDLGSLFIVKEVQRNRYGFKLDTMGKQYYLDNYFAIEKIDKPVKAISGYTVEELQQFCAKLDIPIIKEETKKKKTKAELYEAIVQAMPL
jgi:hypothetical protein